MKLPSREAMGVPKLLVRIRLAVPLGFQLVQMRGNPVQDFPFLVAIELTATDDNATVLQGNRDATALAHNVNMRNPLGPVVPIVTMDVVRNAVRSRDRHSCTS